MNFVSAFFDEHKIAKCTKCRKCFDAYLTKGENMVYFEKNLQKSVDKREKKVYNMRVALRGGIPREHGSAGLKNFFKKLSKKVLTK